MHLQHRRELALAIRCNHGGGWGAPLDQSQKRPRDICDSGNSTGENSDRRADSSCRRLPSARAQAKMSLPAMKWVSLAQISRSAICRPWSGADRRSRGRSLESSPPAVGLQAPGVSDTHPAENSGQLAAESHCADAVPHDFANARGTRKRGAQIFCSPTPKICVVNLVS